MDLQVENLHKAYQDAEKNLVVIQDLTTIIPAGKSVAIVGRSGIGKSTLMHILGGLDRPSSGKVIYGNRDIAALTSDELAQFRGDTIGFIFQFHHLLPEFNALENVSMPLLIAGKTEESAQVAAREVLTQVGLADRLLHRPGELSGGEQQRVAIARAIVGKPKVILADEPTGNLDIETAKDVRELLTDVSVGDKRTIIIVTHNEELAGHMDIVFEMKPGGFLEERKSTSIA